jgi:hypothetical protein
MILVILAETKRMMMITVNADNAGILIVYSDVDAGNFDWEEFY